MDAKESFFFFHKDLKNNSSQITINTEHDSTTRMQISRNIDT